MLGDTKCLNMAQVYETNTKKAKSGSNELNKSYMILVNETE